MARRVRYFRLREQVQAGTWFLGDPLDSRGRQVADIWQFTEGHPIPPLQDRLSVPIDEPGGRLDFSTAGAGVTPILHVRAASIFTELAPDDVQFLPVDIQGQPEQYVILVAKKLVRCIDDEASKDVRYWKPEDGRPEKVGQYRSVVDVRIDPTKVGGAKVFRTWGWAVALIVSEDLKRALESARVTGLRFEEA